MEPMHLNQLALFELMAANKTATVNFDDEPFFSVKTKEGSYPNMTLCYHLNAVDSENFERYNKSVEQKTASPYILFPLNKNSIFLENKLKNGGYRAIDQWLSMQISTHRIFENTTNELRIIAVETPNQLEQWLQVVTTTLFNNRTINPTIFSYLLNKSGVQLWLGVHQNKAVCTTLTFEKENSFGLYMVSTISQMQGQGFGKSMIEHAIKLAQSAGHDKLVLQSTRSGMHLYKKMGFEEIEKHIIYWKTAKEFI